jgi:erythromycin esterase
MTIRPSLQEAGRAFTDDPGVALTSFLRSRPSAPHLLGLGEPMHGEEAFPRLRNRMSGTSSSTRATGRSRWRAAAWPA